MMTVIVMMAQGWPANYGGVMLQGFYWDSYQDSKWTNLTNQVDELSSYFNLIWVPNSGQTKEDRWNSAGNWGFENMGYMPVYWLRHNTCFGTENELKQMINAFKAKGTGIIEDVIINHKNGLTNWADFPNETYTNQETNKTYTLTWADNMEALWGICIDDELFDNDGNHGDDHYWYDTSNANSVSNDEGDNFDGCRDLDHTNAQVQTNIATYLDFLVNELGYVGFRYDMVKGYAGYYVGKYNSELKPKLPTNQEFFSVGEYWDASYNNVVYNWINKTAIPNGEIQSAAFDFPLKYAINDAFNNGHWSVLQGNKGIAGDPNMRRYSVTFVDNHDTYRNDYDRVNNNVLAANAFILGLPGTPCIFLPHWQQYKTEIKKMIAARKAAGINNQSQVIQDWSTDAGFFMKVQGKQTEGLNTVDTNDDRYASVIVISGYIPEEYYLDPNQYELIISGQNFAYYVSKDVADDAKDNYQQIENANSSDFAVYVRDNNEGEPYLYAWTGVGNTDQEKVLGSWPGKKLTQKVTLADGSTWYKQPFKHHDLKVIVHYNQGGDQKTEDISVNGDTYLYYWKGNELKHADYSSIYNSDPQLNHLDVYFDAPSGWNKIYTWENAFYQQKLEPNGGFPGSDLSDMVGTSSTGNNIYRWRINKNLNAGVPNNIIFSKVENSEVKEQTANLKLINAAYYNTSGLAYADKITLNPAIALDGVTSVSATNWNGQTEYVAQAQTETNPSLSIYYPAGTYTVQAIVRGTNDNTLNLAAGSASSSVMLTGMESTSQSTVLPSGAVERNVTFANNGWQKVQSTCTLPEDGVLHIVLSSDATNWQVGALTILNNADMNDKYQTVATTQTTQTNVDVTGNNNLSFYERGANPNALIKANSDILPYNVIVGNTCANLRLTDGAYDFHANEDFTATNISYDRQFTQGKKVTVCLPFAVSATEVSAMGLTVYAFDQVLNDGRLYFKVVDEMAANTPYMVVAGENTTPFANFRIGGNNSIPQTNALEVIKGTDSNTAIFKGTMKRLTLNSGTDATYYGYSNGEFVKVGSNVSINPFRAYIKMAGTSSSTAVNALFEDPSAIRDINASPMNGSDIYTLDGRQVASGRHNLPKGVYIKGGKKFIIK